MARGSWPFGLLVPPPRENYSLFTLTCSLTRWGEASRRAAAAKMAAFPVKAPRRAPTGTTDVPSVAWAAHGLSMERARRPFSQSRLREAPRPWPRVRARAINRHVGRKRRRIFEVYIYYMSYALYQLVLEVIELCASNYFKKLQGFRAILQDCSTPFRAFWGCFRVEVP